MGRDICPVAVESGFPCTLYRCPMGGRHGAGNKARGLYAASPSGRHGPVPLAGGSIRPWVAAAFCWEQTSRAHSSLRCAAGSPRATRRPAPIAREIRLRAGRRRSSTTTCRPAGAGGGSLSLAAAILAPTPRAYARTPPQGGGCAAPCASTGASGETISGTRRKPQRAEKRQHLPLRRRFEPRTALPAPRPRTNPHPNRFVL